MLLVSPVDEMISQRLADELAKVEDCFASELKSSLDCVNTLVSHVERYRGKRLRPLLVLVAAMAVSPDGQTLTKGHRVLATVVEMIHMATLVHDDILDEAQVRRGGQTVNSLRGNETAVMLGDYLISHSYHLCSSLGSQELAGLIASTTNVVCEGELLQLANRENWDLDEKTYFDIIDRKTASLCGVCGRVAALLHGCDLILQDAMDTYGRKLGQAFQIVDDLLDLTGSQATVGKTLGRDLQKGKLTLPLIHCRQVADDATRKTLLELLQAHTTEGTTPTLEQGIAIHDLLAKTQSVAYATRRAEQLINEAREALSNIPDSSARQLLMEMASAVLIRQS